MVVSNKSELKSNSIKYFFNMFEGNGIYLRGEYIISLAKELTEKNYGYN